MKKVIWIILLFLSYAAIFNIGSLDEYRGSRPWVHILDRVIQSEQDAYYLQQCLEREDIIYRTAIEL